MKIKFLHLNLIISYKLSIIHAIFKLNRAKTESRGLDKSEYLFSSFNLLNESFALFFLLSYNFISYSIVHLVHLLFEILI